MTTQTTTQTLGPLMVLARTGEHEAMPYKYPVVQRTGTTPDGQPIAGRIVAYATTEEYAELIAQAPAMLHRLKSVDGWLTQLIDGVLAHTHYCGTRIEAWEGNTDNHCTCVVGAIQDERDRARAILRAVEG